MSSVLEASSCRALVTVQQGCMDCEERYRQHGSCATRFYLPGFAADMHPDAARSLAESKQTMTFDLAQRVGDPATFLDMPAIDNSSGALSFCLDPRYTGVNVFNVSLKDDGVMLGASSASSSVPRTLGPFELIILVRANPTEISHLQNLSKVSVT